MFWLTPALRNEDEEYEEKEEDVGTPLDSTEEVSSSDKYGGGCEEYRKEDGIYDREETLLYDSEVNKEESSSAHERESPLLELLESSEDEDEDDDGTGVDDINGDGRGDKNTNSGRVCGVAKVP